MVSQIIVITKNILLTWKKIELLNDENDKPEEVET